MKMHISKRRLPVAEARLLKALAHPVRLEIARIVSQEESCVCHLEARTGLRQAYLSQQISILRDAGLLAERRVGTFIHYRLADERLVDVITSVQRVAGSADKPLPALDPARCTCPRCSEMARQVSPAPGRIRPGGQRKGESEHVRVS